MNFQNLLSRLENVKGQGADYTARCPSHSDDKNSLSLSEGTDKILLYCHARCSFDEICAALTIDSKDLFFNSKKKPLNHAGNRKTAETANSSGKKQSPERKEIGKKTICSYDYKDETGKLLYQNVRYEITYDDNSTGKTFRQRRLDENGEHVWSLKGVRHVPYRLPELISGLSSNSLETVFLVEGEKDCDNLRKLGLTATSFQKWKPEFNHFIAGANAVILVDHDKSGIKQANDAAKVIKADVKTIKVIDLFEDEPLPDKHGKDVSDWLEIGHSKKELESIIDRSTVWEMIPDTPAVKKASSSQFEVHDDGVYVIDKDGNPLRICSKLEVIAKTRDDKSENWGRLLRWRDGDNVLHHWAMPMAHLSGDGGEYRSRLLSLGLEITPSHKTKELLTNYIQTEKTNSKLCCVGKIGWYQNNFVFPNETVGPRSDEIIFQPDYAPAHKFEVKGTLEEWKQNISKYCIGNSRLAFGVSLAFAAPLLPILDTQSGGFHNRGGTSTGKTTISFVASSVCGGADTELGYCQSWKSTANGLESVAELHNHMLLCLDELGQIDGGQAGDVAYMLANGEGKKRMTKTITSRRSLSWQLLFLSTGEISLADKMSEAGLIIKGGQEIRVLDIPADTCKFGVFEDLHEFPDGQTFADYLRSSARKYYGTAIREFLSQFIKIEIVEVKKEWEAFHKSFEEKVLPKSKKYPPEACRAAERFALVAFAGEMATKLKITNWQFGEAEKAAEIIFQAWFENRTGRGNSDGERAISQIRGFIEAHGSSRFETLTTRGESLDTSKTINRAGFRKRNDAGEIEYLFLSEIFRKEVCKGFDYKVVCRLLDERGFLRRDPAGFQKQIKYGGATMRTYWVSSKILEDPDDGSLSEIMS